MTAYENIVERYKKIIVIGCPGSGKSYYSKKLAKILDIPLYHLDNLYFFPDRTHISREELIEKVNKIAQTDRWLIDGDYTGTIEQRIALAETIVFLDFPIEEALAGASARVGILRDDNPWKEDELEEKFVEYIKAFPVNFRPMILNLLEKYKENKEIIILDNRKNADQWIESLKD